MKQPITQYVFVFGSNLAGYHGKGAALTAKKEHGARQGVFRGRSGMSYAIPTKDEHLSPLPLSAIRGYVQAFLDYAEARPEEQFLVTRVGCGLAGYSDEDIAPMFLGVTSNCLMPRSWLPYLSVEGAANA